MPQSIRQSPRKRRAGLDILTDGEMRRLSFQSQMPEAVEGFGEFDLDAFLWGDWRGGERVGDLRKERPSTLGVVGKLRRKRHLSPRSSPTCAAGRRA